MKNQRLLNKIRNTHARDLILTLVESLKNPPYGAFVSTCDQFEDNGTMWACTTSIAIMSLSGKRYIEGNVETLGLRAKFLGISKEHLDNIETAIDHLTMGFLCVYNKYAAKCGLPIIKPVSFLKLPVLGTSYTHEELEKYVILANWQ